mmetsp:Transcript_13370/g.40469  ORF Transcript_13370/g.40469 Transcript_13370/m.40469 type:complete len:531 (+) Transcript_13370:460-2052(+)
MGQEGAVVEVEDGAALVEDVDEELAAVGRGDRPRAEARRLGNEERVLLPAAPRQRVGAVDRRGPTGLLRRRRRDAVTPPALPWLLLPPRGQSPRVVVVVVDVRRRVGGGRLDSAEETALLVVFGEVEGVDGVLGRQALLEAPAHHVQLAGRVLADDVEHFLARGLARRQHRGHHGVAPRRNRGLLLLFRGSLARRIRLERHDADVAAGLAHAQLENIVVQRDAQQVADVVVPLAVRVEVADDAPQVHDVVLADRRVVPGVRHLVVEQRGAAQHAPAGPPPRRRRPLQQQPRARHVAVHVVDAARVELFVEGTPRQAQRQADLAMEARPAHHARRVRRARPPHRALRLALARRVVLFDGMPAARCVQAAVAHGRRDLADRARHAPDRHQARHEASDQRECRGLERQEPGLLGDGPLHRPGHRPAEARRRRRQLGRRLRRNRRRRFVVVLGGGGLGGGRADEEAGGDGRQGGLHRARVRLHRRHRGGGGVVDGKGHFDVGDGNGVALRGAPVLGQQAAAVASAAALQMPFLA